MSLNQIACEGFLSRKILTGLFKEPTIIAVIVRCITNHPKLELNKTTRRLLLMNRWFGQFSAWTDSFSPTYSFSARGLQGWVGLTGAAPCSHTWWWCWLLPGIFRGLFASLWLLRWLLAFLIAWWLVSGGRPNTGWVGFRSLFLP